ncbi:DUF4349 domain-containing protein [Cellulomonas edaphi]|uniref:DUF4349 domain-containing protein n=1 Tax=Cellulomonas edaphi TaxID=3053468 RepID=A0ABT7S8A8_9CELL|nr:DUF4349 domain-containing protein [Cellulomons edaphi]MDM7831835.1 DUF4349 domain-containing protein [Cellulomons edaphi]
MTTTRTSRRSRRRPLLAGGLVLTVLAATLLAGCSASDEAGDSSVPDTAAGSVGEPAEAPAVDGIAEGSTPDPADQRQVVQTGDIVLKVKNTLKASDAVVQEVERAGGRVDDRTEEASTAEWGGRATLVVRVPATQITATVAAIRTLGTVLSVDLKATDVTGAAQDLDARIRALELSIARMQALLARATTSKDIIDAESALTERQANLEKLRSERSRLADQVALSTLTVTINGPDVAPPPVRDDGPTSFFAGIAVGWDAFVASVKGVLIVLGVLLPWLAFAGAVVAGVVALSRWRRRRGEGAPGVPPIAAAEPVPVGPSPAADAGPVPPTAPRAPRVDPDA